MKPEKILMCSPEYFDVTYEGNEFMKCNINRVNKGKAIEQWNELKKTYETLGFKVELIEPAEGLVDMVFTANQSLPFINKEGRQSVLLSKMRNPQRKDEVKYFRDFFLRKNYEVYELSDSIEYFESMGDAIIDFERKILFGGHGFRTTENTYSEIANYLNYKIITLKLINKNLYHLDTCFSVLNSETAVIDKSAFDEESLSKIYSNFTKVITAEEDENLNCFVCNCHCPDGKNVIVQKGSEHFKEKIEKAGFNIIEVETGEFLKSGGSVFCMKLMFF